MPLLLMLHAASALRLTVTGANGYLGHEICWQAVQKGHSVRAVVRSADRASPFLQNLCEVMEADDLADAVQARAAAEDCDAVIHTASVFQPCDDMEQELVVPNLQLVEEMVCACAASNARLVLTSSMAAVRGAGQEPTRAAHYTVHDWNTVSQRDGPGFAPYQFSKMWSEKRAWYLAREVGLELVTVCPSMILGPPRTVNSQAFSVKMVRGWLEGRSAVKSLLVCDVRDVACAHLQAAVVPNAANKRYIVSREARVPTQALADAMRQRVGDAAAASLRVDDGGESDLAIRVGEREVDASSTLTDLGVSCRPDEETVADMAALLALELAAA